MHRTRRVRPSGAYVGRPKQRPNQRPGRLPLTEARLEPRPTFGEQRGLAGQRGYALVWCRREHIEWAGAPTAAKSAPCTRGRRRRPLSRSDARVFASPPGGRPAEIPQGVLMIAREPDCRHFRPGSRIASYSCGPPSTVAGYVQTDGVARHRSRLELGELEPALSKLGPKTVEREDFFGRVHACALRLSRPEFQQRLGEHQCRPLPSCGNRRGRQVGGLPTVHPRV